MHFENCTSQNEVEASPIRTFDLIFIQSIPRRQEFQAIKQLALSFGGFAVRNIKSMSTTAVYAIVRLYAPLFTHTHPLSSAPLLPFLNETSFSTRLTTETLPPLRIRCQTAYQPLFSSSHLVLVSELFRIIIFVSERHPRDSKLKLSFLAFTRKGEKERERM